MRPAETHPARPPRPLLAVLSTCWVAAVRAVPGVRRRKAAARPTRASRSDANAGRSSSSSAMQALTRIMLRHRWVVLGVWIVVFVGAGLGVVAALGPPHEPLHAAGHRRRSARSRSSRSASASGRSGSFTLVVEDGRRRLPTALVPRSPLRRPPRCRGAADGAARRVLARSGTTWSRRQIVSALEPADAKGRTEADASRHRGDPRSEGLSHRAGGDRARPRPGVRGGPEEGRAVHRGADRDRAARLDVRHARVPAPVRLRARDDPRRRSG